MQTEFRYDLKEQGTLVFTLPKEWAAEISDRSGDELLYLTPRSGDEFNCMLSAMWSRTADPAFNSDEALRQSARRSAEDVNPEAPPAIHELGGGGRGYFVWSRDPLAEPGDGQEFLVQGEVAIAHLRVVFTLFVTKEPPAHLEPYLALLRSIRHLPATR